MSQHKRIFIIGHPGAGKALVAKTLAEKLGWEFIDTDFGLESHIGRTLPEIIGKQGEKDFHHCEAEMLTSLQHKENIVVTTDASIVDSDKNRNLLANEFVVYLKVSTSVQLERNSRKSLPLLLTTDFETFLNKLHQKRDGLYEQIASLMIDSDDNALEEHVKIIQKNAVKDQEKNLSVTQVTLDEKDLIIFHKTLHSPVHLANQQAVCLKLLAQGKSSKEIAREMDISYRTVEGHIAKMMEILGCTSSKELIALYFDQP